MEQLAVSLIFPQKESLFGPLTSLIEQSGCNIGRCQIDDYRGMNHLTMLILGSWNTIAKLEGKLGAFGEKFKVPVSYYRIPKCQLSYAHYPYYLQLVGQDNPGLFAKLSEFFDHHSILIHQMLAQIQPNPFHQKNLSTMTLTILVPEMIPLSEWRDNFIILCDDLNLDVALEAMKP